MIGIVTLTLFGALNAYAAYNKFTTYPGFSWWVSGFCSCGAMYLLFDLVK